MDEREAIDRLRRGEIDALAPLVRQSHNSVPTGSVTRPYKLRGAAHLRRPNSTFKTQHCRA